MTPSNLGGPPSTMEVPMKHIFIGQCLADAAFLPMLSLNAEVELPSELLSDGTPEVGDLVSDPEIPDAISVLEGLVLAYVPAFMASLPERLRYIIHSHYWLMRTQSAIADELGITQSAVAHSLARAHRLGRRYFGIENQ